MRNKALEETAAQVEQLKNRNEALEKENMELTKEVISITHLEHTTMFATTLLANCDVGFLY